MFYTSLENYELLRNHLSSDDKELFFFLFQKGDIANFFEDLLITYLASIAIAAVNFIAPIIFGIFIKFEDYAPSTALQITLIRWVVSRIFIRHMLA